LIHDEICPSMYEGTCSGKKVLKQMFGAVRTELHKMGLGGGGAIPCPAEETGLSTTSANSLLMQDSDCQSAIPVRTQSVLQLLTSTWQSHVSL